MSVLELTDRLAEVEIKSAWSDLQALWTEMQKKQAAEGPTRVIVGFKKANKAAAKKPGWLPKESIDTGFAEMWKITGTHEFNQKVVKTYLQHGRGRQSHWSFAPTSQSCETSPPSSKQLVSRQNRYRQRPLNSGDLRSSMISESRSRRSS
jgi:hypothetical protein